MELQFDPETTLPIDPVSGEPFIPGTMGQTRSEMGGGFFNIQMDPDTGFPPPPPDNLMGGYVPGEDMNSQRMRM